MPTIGYCRVSTDDQSTALQLDALKATGCERIFSDDGVSGATAKRPGLAKALKSLKGGDTLVVYSLSRAGRSLRHLLELADNLQARGVDFRSLTEAIDTSGPAGRLVFHLLASLAQFERELLAERTRAGAVAARARGQHMGRPKALDRKRQSEALKRLRAGEPIAEVAALCGVGYHTIWRLWRDHEAGARKSA
jgi:DNA invertase Pin-like site-specific DNA recombinase